MQQTQPAAVPDTSKPSLQQVLREASHRLGWPGGALVIGALAVVSLIAPLGGPGLWEPNEVDTADFGRRVAIALGAQELTSTSAANDLPTLEDVGRGELPVLAVGVALRLFGASEWAVRLPFALFALLGLSITAWASRRMLGSKVALYASLVLCTSPIYFVHARTALGSAIEMGSFALAFFGLASSVFDLQLSTRGRLFAVLAGVLGLGLGFVSGGALTSVATPALAVGGVWLLRGGARPGPGRGSSPGVRSIAIGAMLVGLLAAALGLWSLAAASSDNYLLGLAREVVVVKKLPTYDAVIGQLGHGMFPWSVLVPLAAAAALVGDPQSKERLEQGSAPSKTRESFLLAAVLAVALSLAAATLVSVKVQLPAFQAVSAIAVLVAVVLHKLDGRQSGAPLLMMFAAASLILLFKDFDNFPSKVFAAYGGGDPKFPSGFESDTRRFFGIALALPLLCFAVLSLEWVTPRRWAAWLSKRFGAVRGTMIAISLAAGGLVLSVGYYPALAHQISPMSAFSSYESFAKQGEPLGVIGKGKRTAFFFHGGGAEFFSSVDKGVNWMGSKDDGRRFLVLKEHELARANSVFRKSQKKDVRNLPILDAGSSNALLASNLLGTDESDHNPFKKMLPDALPAPPHPTPHRFDKRLRLLGWGIFKAGTDEATDDLVRGRKYDFRMYYQVLAPISKTWKTFIHIDGQGTRFNGDHDTLGGKYDFRFWNRGDFVVDSHQFEMGREYGAGEYKVHFGLFAGKDRFSVSSGEHQENRIYGGDINLKAR